MAVKIYNVEFQRMALEPSLRNDSNFISFENAVVNRFYKFKELFEIVNDHKVPLENLNDDFYYVEIGNADKLGNVFPVKLNFNNRQLEDEDYYKKIEKGNIIKVQKGDILISKVRPYLKKILLIDDDNSKYYYTSAFIHIRPKKMGKIMYYCMRTLFFENLIAISRQGKGYPTINETDLLSMKFDASIIDLLLKKEQELLQKIEQRESEILQLERTRKPESQLINDIFKQEFSLNLNEYHEKRKIRIFQTSLESFSANLDLRNSVKFHWPSGQYVYNELKKQSSKKIKDYISEPIVLGKSISPVNYDEEGESYYISMAAIKDWRFNPDSENAKTISEQYYNENKATKSIQKGDIILARSGKGTIGKVALIDNDNHEGIFADFTMRIRLKSYLPRFAYYYFRTTYFQHLLEVNWKGLGNNLNIFPSQIQELPIPDITIEEQERIVSLIKGEIDLQNQSTEQIIEKQLEVESLIEQSLKS